MRADYARETATSRIAQHVAMIEPAQMTARIEQA
jgi:hypothetical protein